MYWVLLAVVAVSGHCLADSLYTIPLKVCCGCTDTLSSEHIYIEEYLKCVLSRVLTGRTCAGKNQMDPLYIDEVTSDFATVKFNSTNNTITGLSRSKVTFLRVSEDIHMVTFKLDVPSFLIEGSLNFTGYLLYLASSGDGRTDVEFGRTLIKVYALLTQLTGCNNCMYLQFGNFSMNPLSLSQFNFNITPIYGECHEDVTKQRNRFMDEHWEDMAFFGQGPVLNPIIQKLLTYSNEFLLNIPMNDLLNSYNLKNHCPILLNSTDGNHV